MLPPQRSRLTADDMQAIRAFVLSGYGIGLLPDAITPGTSLRRVLPEFSTEQAHVYFVYPAQRYLSPNVRVFIEMARAAAKELGAEQGMSFEALWQQYHPAAQPLGWILRDVEKSNWVRFHSLPRSKRYPDSDAERSTILRRENTLADEILGAHASWLVCCRPVGFRNTHARPYNSLVRRYAMTSFWSFQAEDEVQFSVCAARLDWQAGAFDEVLLQIADDQVRALWVSEATGAVFAPYDGGTDCILPSMNAMQALKTRHKAWLSSHPEGL